MRRIAFAPMSILMPIALFCLTFFPACPAEAVLAPEILEATGYLEKYDESVSQPEMTLNVNGTLASAPVGEECEFFDEKGSQIEREEFIKKYMKRMITVDIMENSGLITSCRVGS